MLAEGEKAGLWSKRNKGETGGNRNEGKGETGMEERRDEGKERQAVREPEIGTRKLPELLVLFYFWFQPCTGSQLTL